MKLIKLNSKFSYVICDIVQGIGFFIFFVGLYLIIGLDKVVGLSFLGGGISFVMIAQVTTAVLKTADNTRSIAIDLKELMELVKKPEDD